MYRKFSSALQGLPCTIQRDLGPYVSANEFERPDPFELVESLQSELENAFKNSNLFNHSLLLIKLISKLN